MRECMGILLWCGLGLWGCASGAVQAFQWDPEDTEVRSGLNPPGAFASISDPMERSKAVFREMLKVIRHPRCSNCHPAGDRPLQGDGRPHQPLVVRGSTGFGAAAMGCGTCHGAEHFRNVPGNAVWHLAPVSMAWQDLPDAEICQQILDPARNGGRSHEELLEHMRHDPLVAYGWSPPEHLEPAPGDQETFGALVHGWLAAGAHCP